MKPSRSAAELDPAEEWEAMLPELKATLQQLLTLPQEGEGMSEMQSDVHVCAGSCPHRER